MSDNNLEESREWILEKLKRLDVRIESQYAQIHNRYTWFLVTQGFLFTAYALTFSRDPLEVFETVWRVMFFGLPVLGCVSVIMCVISVYAHKDFIETLKPKREKLEDAGAPFGIDSTEAPINSYWHRNGLFSILYPLFVGLFWIISLIVSVDAIIKLEI